MYTIARELVLLADYRKIIGVKTPVFIEPAGPNCAQCTCGLLLWTLIQNQDGRAQWRT